jgi:hypothetical protein
MIISERMTELAISTVASRALAHPWRPSLLFFIGNLSISKTPILADLASFRRRLIPLEHPREGTRRIPDVLIQRQPRLLLIRTLIGLTELPDKL